MGFSTSRSCSSREMTWFASILSSTYIWRFFARSGWRRGLMREGFCGSPARMAASPRSTSSRAC